jgi:vacuolar-type H+-ATPase subunit I/STV1
VSNERQVESLSNVKRQLRGSTLDDRIRAVIRELAEVAYKGKREYVFNASEVARLVPTTRKSLDKHEEAVDELLAELSARRRLVSGEATNELYRDQIAQLKETVAQKDRLIGGLRSALVQIYDRFLGSSIEGELVLRLIAERESQEIGYCLLCGAGTPNSPHAD